jgi:integrase
MAIRQMPFTKRALLDLPAAPQGKRLYVRDTQYPQLHLQITSSGYKSFQAYCWGRNKNGEGTAVRTTLGKFDPDDPGALSVAQARRMVPAAVKNAKGGKIPAEQKRAARGAATVKDLADEYIERHAKVKKKSWKEDVRQLEKDILPLWRKRKVKDITQWDVGDLIQSIEDRGSEVQARRTYALLSRMFRYGMTRKKFALATSPCIPPEFKAEQTPRTRSLSAKEIRTLWPKLSPESNALSMDVRVRLILRLMLATGQRPGECREMEWSEIDGLWWQIPWQKRKRTKKRKDGSDTVDHRVYLNSTALKVLETARVLSDGCRFVFGSPAGDMPMTKVALSNSVQRNLNAFGFEPFTAHDLRRTVATQMGDIGVHDFDIRQVQGHALSGMGKVYNQSSYDKTKRLALSKWDRGLAEIITGKKRDEKVTEMWAS